MLYTHRAPTFDQTIDSRRFCVVLTTLGEIDQVLSIVDDDRHLLITLSDELCV